MEERLRIEINEGTRIKEEVKRLTRTGRQPSMQVETDKAKKREDRLSGRSFEGESSNEPMQSDVDTNSFSTSNNMMMIPEDEKDDLAACFGG